MSSTEFHIVSRWRLKGTVDDVYDIISKPQDFVRWWSSVYLNVVEIDSGDSNGVGRTVRLHTKGLLPYTLNWQAKTTEIDKPNRIVVDARGDLRGRGVWCIKQDGEWVNTNFHWTVITHKSWMRYLSPVLKPVFAANHRWAMNKGQQGLEEELAQRASRSAWQA
jgi:hypothetical protein